MWSAVVGISTDSRISNLKYSPIANSLTVDAKLFRNSLQHSPFIVSIVLSCHFAFLHTLILSTLPKLSLCTTLRLQRWSHFLMINESSLFAEPGFCPDMSYIILRNKKLSFSKRKLNCRSTVSAKMTAI